MEQYKLQSKKGDGAFSEVFKAKSMKTSKHVAIKCMKKKFDSIEKVKRLKEIQALKLLSPNQNIIKLIQVLYDQPTGKINQLGKLALVFQLMQINMYQCLKARRLTNAKVKFYMYQLLRAIDYIHKKGIFHRDIKPQNVLLTGDHVKLADFGSCKGMYTQQPYTQYISTRWYRAPQCLMTDGYYDAKMDIWGFGCVLFQMISKFPLFPGRSEQDQVNRINNILGTPNNQLIDRFKHRALRIQMSLDFTTKRGCGIEKVAPDLSKQVIDLLYKLLAYDPHERISAEQALKHQYFSQFHTEDMRQIYRQTFCSLKPQHTLPRDQSEDKLKSTTKVPTKVLKNQTSKGVLMQKIKKNMSKATIDDDPNQLPPIHQIGFEMKVNVYGHSTVKGNEIFKKTTHGMNYPKTKKFDPIGYIVGKRAP